MKRESYRVRCSGNAVNPQENVVLNIGECGFFGGWSEIARQGRYFFLRNCRVPSLCNIVFLRENRDFRSINKLKYGVVS